MKRLPALLLTILFFACHDRSDHNVVRTPKDSLAAHGITQPKDTSLHSGTIPSVMDRWASELKMVPVIIGPGEAFAQLMLIHRKAVLEICQIESSEGGREEVFVLVAGIQARSETLSKDFERYLRDHVPGKKTNALRFTNPFDKNEIERMTHQGPDTDELFLKMIVTLYTSEITLAESYLEEGKNKYLTALARQVIADNRKEIAALK